MLRLKLAVPALLALLLAGCSTVTTTVDASSSIPAELEPRTVFITPADPDKADSPDWQANNSILAGILLGKGFTPLQGPEGARLLARYDYEIDDGVERIVEYVVPVRGIIGYRQVQVGPPGPNGGPAPTSTRPVWGVIGHDLRSRVEVTYTSQVDITMRDARSGNVVFEGSGVSRGPCGAFQPQAAAIVGAVLSGFPEGRQGEVTMRSETRC